MWIVCAPGCVSRACVGYRFRFFSYRLIRASPWASQAPPLFFCVASMAVGLRDVCSHGAHLRDAVCVRAFCHGFFFPRSANVCGNFVACPDVCCVFRVYAQSLCRPADYWHGYKLFCYAYFSHFVPHEAEFRATKLGRYPSSPLRWIFFQPAISSAGLFSCVLCCRRCSLP